MNKCCYNCKHFKRLLAEDFKAGAQGYCCRIAFDLYGIPKDEIRINGKFKKFEFSCDIVSGYSHFCPEFIAEDSNLIGRMPNYPN